jgi:hypothetical protein
VNPDDTPTMGPASLPATVHKHVSLAELDRCAHEATCKLNTLPASLSAGVHTVSTCYAIEWSQLSHCQSKAPAERLLLRWHYARCKRMQLHFTASLKSQHPPHCSNFLCLAER